MGRSTGVGKTLKSEFRRAIKRDKNEAAGDRTQDPQIKSLLLYLLSYGLKSVSMEDRITRQRTLFYAPG